MVLVIGLNTFIGSTNVQQQNPSKEKACSIKTGFYFIYNNLSSERVKE